MTIVKHALLAATALGATVALAAPASASTLDFSGNICGVTGDQACSDGTQIGQTYGDGTGVDVGYRSVNTGTGLTYETFLKTWTNNYGDLQNVVWGGPNASQTYSEITFTALAGYEITLTGFDAGCYLNRASCQSFPFTIQEIGGGTVASGATTPPAAGHSTEAFGLGYSTTGYILTWGPDGYDGGLDNIGFDVRAVAGAVPEPSTWAMMLLGFAAVGGMMRRRRHGPVRTVTA